MGKRIAVVVLAVVVFSPATIARAGLTPTPIEGATVSVTPEEAVELSPVGNAASLAAIEAEVDVEGEAAAYCWYSTWTHTRGTWPYAQNAELHTTWCGNGSWITYRSSWTTSDSWLCSGHDEYARKLLGGYGYEKVLVEGGASFDCPTPVPWVTLHARVWIEVNYDARGGTWAEDWS